ncbi:MAG: hypothetical protein KKA81_14205, partial [Bacteroidetes bacterium]|nr:hypothetical protein [Bacteroidota bacterium]
EMIWYGKAHSGSDILIFIPESGMLMSGDLFFPGGRPSLNQYEPEDTVQWLIAQKWLRKRLDNIELVVGGHGQIMNREDVESFLERSKPPTVN